MRKLLVLVAMLMVSCGKEVVVVTTPAPTPTPAPTFTPHPARTPWGTNPDACPTESIDAIASMGRIAESPQAILTQCVNKFQSNHCVAICHAYYAN